MNPRQLFLAIALLLPMTFGSKAASADEDLYQAVTVVTGQGEANRRLGFRDCLGKVLARVSGDPDVASGAAFDRMRSEADRFVASFRYRDRMEGVPIHDEQGTYDRPHDLTCVYEPATVDGLLGRLGSRPWLSNRPVLAVFLTVERGSKRFQLTRDGAEGSTMRESFDLAAGPMAMRVVFPAVQSTGPAESDTLEHGDWNAAAGIARQAGGEEPLVGSITWSDAELGWIAEWRLFHDGSEHRWQVRGVSFDEAFRMAVRGAARILSGNGAP